MFPSGPPIFSRKMGLHLLFFLLFAASTALTAKVTRQTCIHDICYFIPYDHVLKVELSLNVSCNVEDELIPLSVVNLDLPNIQHQDILDSLSCFNTLDDVWSPQFASCR